MNDRERKALALLRLLHVQQQDALLVDMERQVVANRIANRLAMRAGGLRKLKIPADRKVAKAFGIAPHAKRRPPAKT